jgi:hypothetical protein
VILKKEKNMTSMEKTGSMLNSLNKQGDQQQRGPGKEKFSGDFSEGEFSDFFASDVWLTRVAVVSGNDKQNFVVKIIRLSCN